MEVCVARHPNRLTLAEGVRLISADSFNVYENFPHNCPFFILNRPSLASVASVGSVDSVGSCENFSYDRNGTEIDVMAVEATGWRNLRIFGYVVCFITLARKNSRAHKVAVILDFLRQAKVRDLVVDVSSCKPCLAVPP